MKGSNKVSPSSRIVTLSSSNSVIQSWNTWCSILSGIVFACGFHGRLFREAHDVHNFSYQKEAGKLNCVYYGRYFDVYF